MEVDVVGSLPYYIVPILVDRASRPGPKATIPLQQEGN